jgi:carbonic anhydrase
MKTFRLCLIALLFGCVSTTTRAADEGRETDKILRLLQQGTMVLLKEGNIRHATGHPQHPNQEPERRIELARNGQEPLVTVLACSDSRDPVEQIFDRGVGDLFVIRVAGNVAGTSEMATVEYGVTHLGTPVLLVMGHTKCGAVTAVVKGAELHGHLVALAKLIQPAASKAKGDAATPDDAVPIAIQLNVWQQIESLLTRSELVRDAAKSGKVLVQGAVYDISSGKVAWLGSHPEMERIMNAPATALSSHEAKPSQSKPPVLVPTPPAHGEPKAGKPSSEKAVAGTHH